MIRNAQLLKLDDIDRKILTILQRDATQSVQDIADVVGLTSNPCWRRIKRMEDEGLILRRVAVVDPGKLGFGMTAFVRISTETHTKDWLTTFKASVKVIPEIVECHRMTGDVDYLLKIVVEDLSHYDKVYQRLLDLVPNLKDVSAAFSMERMKEGEGINLATMG